MAKCVAGQTLAKVELAGARTCGKYPATAPERSLGHTDAALTPTLLRLLRC
ncbi:hypothetical protein KGQ20_27855 [Catenulispora sp. NF23]|uniref:Uncharacterized protein n=1 Tax=Catenulispora pinistramenti TaxID=2705254 RepID=A0ABS5L2I7_9ACTN|nr:hypothetical protein [Catenulispora pinistramenti]MBS2536582.1 hypothetical protein [Catenulispora pinistramenti]MBS2552552.1 hypothetical protein [Catenulispora pinistramenti]